MVALALFLSLVAAAPNRPWHPKDEPRPGNGRLLNYIRPETTTTPWGSLSIRYSLPVPDFRGIQPKVGLDYNSDNTARGELGLGWVLMASSRIVAKGPSREPIASARPTYWLDGAELLSCVPAVSTGASCKSGGTYELRDDNGSRIVREGGDWVVTQSDGVKSIYREVVPGEWHLKSRQDRQGNLVEWFYTTTLTSNAVVSQIRFGSEPVPSDRYHIDFHYVPTTNRAQTVAYSGLSDSGLELKAIRIRLGSTTRDLFMLSYSTAGSERWLESVQQFGRGSWLDSLSVAHGESAPPIRMRMGGPVGSNFEFDKSARFDVGNEGGTWGIGTGPFFPARSVIAEVEVPLFETPTNPVDALSLLRTEWMVGEFNGDMSSDFVGVRIRDDRIDLNFVSSTGQHGTVTTPWVLPDPPDGTEQNRNHQLIVGNLDGDGLSDIILVMDWVGGPAVFRAFSTGFGRLNFETVPAAIANSGCGLTPFRCGPFRVFSSDRNGDGLTDITIAQQYDPQGVKTTNSDDDFRIQLTDFLSTGVGFEPIIGVPFVGNCASVPPTQVPDMSQPCMRPSGGSRWSSASTTFMFVGDVDGDGDSDFTYLAPTSLSAAAIFNWRPGFLGIPALLPSAPFPFSDEACATNYPSSRSVAWVAYANGLLPSSSFSRTSLERYCAPNNLYWSGGLGAAERLSGDFNGDGRMDILLLTPSDTTRRLTSRFLFSTGDGFEDVTVPNDLRTELSPSLYPLGQLFAADIDGDGRSDLVSVSPWDLQFTPGVVTSENRVRVFRSDGRGGLALIVEGDEGLRPSSTFGFTGCTRAPHPTCGNCNDLCGGPRFQAFASDSDGDGRAEISFASESGAGATTVGQTQSSVAMPSLGEFLSGDVNGDGISDSIRVRHVSGSIEVVAALGGSTTVWGATSFSLKESFPGDDGQAVVGDFWSKKGGPDGLADVLVYSPSRRLYVVILSDRTKWLVDSAHRVMSTLATAPSLRAADVDGDGDSDLLLMAQNVGGGSVRVVTIRMANLPTSTALSPDEFAQNIISAGPLGNIHIGSISGGLANGFVLDFRGRTDHVLESYVMSAGSSAGPWTWNRTGGATVPFEGASSWGPADINNDGVLDLMQVRTGYNSQSTIAMKLSALTGDGTGSFQFSNFTADVPISTTAFDASPAFKFRHVFVDLDGDGDTDVVSLPIPSLLRPAQLPASKVFERRGDSWLFRHLVADGNGLATYSNSSGRLESCGHGNVGQVALCYATIDSATGSSSSISRVYQRSRWLFNQQPSLVRDISNGSGLSQEYTFRPRAGHGESYGGGFEVAEESWFVAGGSYSSGFSDSWKTAHNWSGYAYDYSLMRPIGARLVVSNTVGTTNIGVTQQRNQRRQFARGICSSRLEVDAYYGAGASRETSFHTDWLNIRSTNEPAVHCVPRTRWKSFSDYPEFLNYQTLTYDRYGNLLDDERSGLFRDANRDGVDDYPADNFTISRRFTLPGAAYVANRPYDEFVRVGASLVEKRNFEYDNQSVGTPVDMGLRTAVMEWDNNIVSRAETRYDSFGNVLGETSAAGIVTSFSIDAIHRLFVNQKCVGTVCEGAEWDAVAQLPSALISSAGSRTTLSYDPFGRVKRKVFPDFGCVDYSFTRAFNGSEIARVDICDGTTNDGLGSGNGLWTDFLLDGLGRDFEVRRAGGGVTAHLYWLDSNEFTSFSTWQPGLPIASDHTVQHRDSLGEVTLTEYPGGGATSQVSRFANTVRDTDENGISRQSELDGFGRTKRVVEALGSTSEVSTQYFYDHAGRTVATVNSYGDRREAQYNARGFNELECDPSSGCSSREFLLDGRVSWEVDQSGRKIDFKYDSSGRLIERSSPSGSYFQRWYYDVDPVTGAPSGASSGYLVGTETSSGVTQAFEIDVRGRAVVNQVCSGICSQYSEVYSPSGLLRSVTTAGTAVQYEYDIDGEVSSVSSHGLVVSHFPSGNLKAVTLASGAKQEWSEEPLRGWRSETRVTDKNGIVVFEERRTPGPHGETTARQLTLGSTVSSETIIYDELYRVVRVEDASSAAVIEDFAYDLRGNPTSSSLSGAMTYGPGGPVHGITASDWGIYSYDPAGRTVTHPAGSFTWDHGGDLTEVNLASGSSVHFAYAPERRRVSKRTSGLDQFEFSRYYSEINGVGVSRVFVDDLPILEGKPGNWVSVHPDLIGSATLSLNAAGFFQAKRSYSAFGFSPSSQISQSSFGGHREDNETGLLLMGERYFDPRVGRFLSPDPEVVPKNYSQGLNRYSYGLNSPYDYVDPTGRTPLHLALAIAGIAMVVYWKNCEERPLAPVVMPLAVAFAPVVMTRLAFAEMSVESGQGQVDLYKGIYNEYKGQPSNQNFTDARGHFQSALIAGFILKLAGDFRPVASEVLSNRAAGRIIGWPTQQQNAGLTAEMARGLTAEQVAEMRAMGLNRATVENLRAQYQAAIDAGKAASNAQLQPRLQLMERILELWPQ